MLDPKLLRGQLDEVATRLQTRGFTLDVAAFARLEEKRKSLQVETENLQADRKRKSKEIGIAKGKGEDVSALMKEVDGFAERLADCEKQLESLQAELLQLQLGVPNIPHTSVPVGGGENDNVEVRRWGTPPTFDFAPQDHADLGSKSGSLDFETAVKISGARFSVMYGPLARMHRAL
ncbi:MAG TPA: serine--tRNA ligase, partial [Dongiaceae bacterium]|nr:serine--tRNA ligase [Dongiaceae bacterium]